MNIESTGVLPYNDKEGDLIRATFKGNEELLKAMRAVIFDLSPSADEKALVASTFAKAEVIGVIRRRFLPQLDKNAPIGQVGDVWLGAESMVFAQQPGTIQQALEYKEGAIKMTAVALDLLVNPDGPKVEGIAYSPRMYPQDPLGINLLARNQFVRHIESQLSYLWVVANQEVKADDKPKRGGSKPVVNRDSSE